MASLPWARALYSISASSSGVICVADAAGTLLLALLLGCISPSSSSRSAMAAACSSVSAYSRPRSEK